MYTILCTAYFHTHFPVSSPSLFEYDNVALSYVGEAYVIYLTCWVFREKPSSRYDCDDPADKS